MLDTEHKVAPPQCLSLCWGAFGFGFGRWGGDQVWAVEFTDMAKHAVQLVRHNGVAEVVTVVKGAVEELDLPPKSVDLMVSEWMGYFLLRESMLDSVIRARDRLLKPGGVMAPSAATMFWGAIECEEDRQQKEADLAESLRDWKEFTDETARCGGWGFAGLAAGSGLGTRGPGARGI